MTTMLRAEMVRADCARGFSELVRRLGGDPEPLLREALLEPVALADPHAYISHRGLIQALERAAQILDCPDFGLRLAAEQDISVLGPMAVVMSNAPTVGDALESGAKYLYTHAPAVQFSLHPAERSEQVLLKLDMIFPRLGRCRQASELHIGLLHRIVGLLSQGRCRPLGVTFRHRPIAFNHAQIFGVPVTFEAEADALVVAAKDLLDPIRGRDQQLQEIAAGYLDTHFPAPPGRLAAQVRLLAEKLLGADRCTQAEAAAALGMQVRTLQRRLHEEGTSFEELRDDARRTFAVRYLAQADLPLSQVSALLGYAEPSALSRSCRRWFGKSPREMRAEPG